MRQLLEYTAFNISKISKNEKNINVLTNEEVRDIIFISTNNNVVMTNPSELTRRMVSEEIFKESDGFIKVSIDKEKFYENTKKNFKDLKIKLKKYTHYSLLNNTIEELNEIKISLIKEIEKQEKLFTKVKTEKDILSKKIKLSNKKNDLLEKMEILNKISLNYGIEN